MSRYLLDTNHVGALLRNDPQMQQHIAGLKAAELSICLPSVGELWYMVYNSARPSENRIKLLALLNQFQLVPFGMSESEEFGKLRAELRKLGRPIPQIDLQIAAIARFGKFVLATADNHFQHIPGLQTEDWTKPGNATSPPSESSDPG